MLMFCAHWEVSWVCTNVKCALCLADIGWYYLRDTRLRGLRERLAWYHWV